MVDLTPENLEQMVTCLEELNFKPIIPVQLSDFLDPELRKQWLEERNMTVFSVTSDQMIGLTLDLFVQEPFPFEEAYQQALVDVFRNDIHVPFVNINQLIQMKEAVGREQDLLDVSHLKQLRDDLQN